VEKITLKRIWFLVNCFVDYYSAAQPNTLSKSLILIN
jgi:hypothetical protein